MLKLLIFFGFVLAFSASIQVQHGTPKKIEADQEYLMKEKSILQILAHIHQETVVPELRELNKEYDLNQNLNNFNDVKSVKRFIKLYKTEGIMDRRRVFTPLYESHVQQAKAVFEVLHSAKDWNTFIKTASWMRDHINDGLFLYAFYSSLLHRPDSQNLVLPPLYEVCPHLFLNAEIIQSAHDIRMKSHMKKEREVFVLNTNYTGWANIRNPELRVSYFTEDVGLNLYHFMHHITYPNWLQAENIGIKNERQGELFYFLHEQILARYKLERHANYMYPMKNFSYEEPHITAYSPNLRYTNGQSVPFRPENIVLRNFDSADIEHLKGIEAKLREAIASGYVETGDGQKRPLTITNGIEILGRLMESTNTFGNAKSYGSLYQLILNLMGHIVDPYHQSDIPPSTLQHYHSMLRDPMYYSLYQRIHKLFASYKKTLPVYTRESLDFPGVDIESVEVDKLMTFFETFNIDITNVIGISEVDDDKMLKIVVRQPRLNHKDFTYRVNVNSNQDVMGMIHVYLAPKFDVLGMREMSLHERKEYMVLLDKFPHRIQRGKTVIERSSKDFTVLTGDMTPFRILYKKVEDAIQGKTQFLINDKGHEYGFPNRLILPKGTKSGAPYVIYVMISPYQASGSAGSVRGMKTFLTCGDDVFCMDSYPLGYPFDREIVASEFTISNFYMTNVHIYHKKMETSPTDI